MSGSLVNKIINDNPKVSINQTIEVSSLHHRRHLGTTVSSFSLKSASTQQRLTEYLFIILLGKVRNGLLCSPDGLRAFYPLGSSIVARTIGGSGKQTFLTGHTYPSGCIDISKSGNYLVSGETSNVGTKVTLTSSGLRFKRFTIIIYD